MAEREDKTLRVSARQMDPSKFPDLENINKMTLREGPRSRTELKYTRIKSRHTGKFHHDSLTLKSYKKLKGEWQPDPTKSISLSSDDSDELPSSWSEGGRAGGGLGERREQSRNPQRALGASRR